MTTRLLLALLMLACGDGPGDPGYPARLPACYFGAMYEIVGVACSNMGDCLVCTRHECHSLRTADCRGATDSTTSTPSGVSE